MRKQLHDGWWVIYDRDEWWMMDDEDGYYMIVDERWMKVNRWLSMGDGWWRVDDIL